MARVKNKFKVGDKVKITANYTNHQYEIGSIQEIKFIDEKTHEHHCKYKCKDNEMGGCWISGKCAELIEEPEKQESYREYKGIKYPTNMDAFLMLGPYGSEDSIIDYVRTIEECGGMPDELYIRLKEKFGISHPDDLIKKLQEYWRGKYLEEQRQQYKYEYEDSIKKMYESAKPLLPHQVYGNPLIANTPESNPLSKLVCKKQKKSLDLSPKKIREVKIKT